MRSNKFFLKQQIIFFLLFHVTLSTAQNIFVENKGQFPDRVITKTVIPSGSMFIEKGRFIFLFYDQNEFIESKKGIKKNNTINAHSYSLTFYKPNKKSSHELVGKSSFFENYYLGEKSQWAENVRLYEEYYEKNLYKGIDLRVYSDKKTLKYEFIINPHTNTKKIQYSYEGADDLFLSNKNLYIKTRFNTIIEEAPYAYQVINKDTINIECEYKLKNKTITYFFPKGYNKEYKLIIDPTLIFSTYSGSAANNFGYTATYDNEGFLYSGSTVFGPGYPVTMGVFQIDFSGGTGITTANPGTDIAITKYDTTGQNIIYSTYIGGEGDELPHSMVVNDFGELFLLGTTGSINYPTTLFSYDTTFNGGYSFTISGLGVSFPKGSDIVVSKLSKDAGNLLSSTFLGGASNDGLNLATKLNFNYGDEVRGEIEIDQENNIYIASSTKSKDFPVTNNSFQPIASSGQEGCIIKMDNNLTTIIWSSYLGSTEQDAIYSITTNKDNDIYVCGGTTSPTFPTTQDAYQNTYLDSLKADAYVSKINSEGTELIYSSFFGSNEYDQGYFVEIAKNKEVYLFGQTEAKGTTLMFNASYFHPDGGQFIAIFSEDLSNLKKSTIIGTGKGSPDISLTASLIDQCNRIYLSGWGSQDANLGWQLSTLNLPTTTNSYQNITDGHDFYLIVLEKDLESIIYATYFGGSQSKEHVDGGTSRFDNKGIIYQCVCAGCGGYNDFPTTQGAFSDSNGTIIASPPITNGCNSAVFKLDMELPMVIANFLNPKTECDLNISFQNTSKEEGNTNYFWDFGDNTTSTQFNPTHTYSQPGIYEVMLIASSITACNQKDTITKKIYIIGGATDTILSLKKCKTEEIQIGLPFINSIDVSFFWTPSAGLSSNNVANPYTDIDSTTEYQLIIIGPKNCRDTITQKVVVDDFYVDAGNDTTYCFSSIELEGKTPLNRGRIDILWSSNKFFNDTLGTEKKLIVDQIGVYYIKAYNEECEAIDSVKILAKQIDIELEASQNNCKGDSVYIEVYNNSTTEITSFEWDTGAFFYNKDSSATQYIIDSARWYSVTITNTEGCVLTDSIYIDGYSYPNTYSIWAEDTIIYKGENTTLHVDSKDSIVWLLENDTVTQDFIIVSPKENTTYHVEIHNNNCKKKEAILIRVKSVFCQDSIKVPNAFTPEETINKTYFITLRKEIIKEFKLEIFNRLGERVFKTTNPEIHWNGKRNGSFLPSQVFDFYVEIICVDGERFFKKGNITLIR